MTDALAVATALVDDLIAGRFDAVHARFSLDMAGKLPVEQLAGTWQQLSAQVGEVTAGAPLDRSPLTIVPLLSAVAELEVALAVVDDGKVAGLFIRPRQQEVSWTPPAYDDRGSYSAEDVVVDAGVPLPGTLRTPLTGGLVPGVVIVHGSGPGDRDGTVATVKPYRDLAVGLASAGVAALTYDKRTKVAPGSFGADFTVEDEVLADVRAAVTLLADRPGVDPARIVVVGHSLGAMLGPRLAAEGAPIAALVLLCAPARGLDEVALEQVELQASLGGPPAEAVRGALHLGDAEVAALAALRSGEAVEGPLPLGLPAGYWLDLDTVDPTATAASLSIPVHVVQGGHDVQVLEVDTALWQAQAALADNLHVTVLEEMTHLLTDSPERRVEAYDDHPHVTPALVSLVAEVVLGP